MDRRVAAALGVLLAAGCSLPGTVARRTAAADHSCPVSQVRVEAEERQGDQPWAYWLNVCGERRYYRRDEATLGSGSVSFYDATATAVGRPRVAASDADSPLNGVPMQGRVRSRYDDAARATALELTLPIGRAALQLVGTPAAGDTLRVTATSLAADRYQWTGCAGIEIAGPNGDALPVSPARYQFARQRDGAYAERVSAELPFDAFARSVADALPHGSVCGQGFELAAYQRAAVSEFVTRWRRAAPADRPAANNDAGGTD